MSQQHTPQDQEQLQKKRETWEYQVSLPVLVSGILFALDLVFIQNLVQGDGPTGWRVVALLFFAIALPCLAANAFIMHRMRGTKTVLPGKARLFFYFQLMGYFASIVGVWASITAVSWWIGLIFVIVTLAAVGICFSALNALDKQTLKDDAATQP